MMSRAGFGSFAHTDLSLLLKESVRLCQLVPLLEVSVCHIVLLYICTQLYGEQILLFCIGGFFSSLD